MFSFYRSQPYSISKGSKSINTYLKIPSSLTIGNRFRYTDKSSLRCVPLHGTCNNQNRNFSFIKRIKSFFNESAAPRPPNNLLNLKNYELISTRDYIQKEMAYFDMWSHKPEVKKEGLLVSDYFSELVTMEDSGELEVAIRDGNAYYLSLGVENLLFRMKFDGRIYTRREIMNMYESKDERLHVLLNNELLDKYHSEWFGSGKGLYNINSIAYKDKILAYAITKSGEEGDDCAIFIRDMVSGELIDEIHTSITKYVPNTKRIKKGKAVLSNISISSFGTIEIAKMPPQKMAIINDTNSTNSTSIEEGAQVTTSRIENDENNEKIETASEQSNLEDPRYKPNYILFYTIIDDKYRPYSVARHKIGGLPIDELLLLETNESVVVDLRKTTNDKYITIYSGTNHETEVSIIPTENAIGPLQRISKRNKGLRYYVEHSGDHLYIFTNANGNDLTVMRTSIDKPGIEHWEPFAVCDDQQVTTEVDIYEKHLILYENVMGMNRIRIVDTETEESQIVPIPVPYGIVAPSLHPDFDSKYAYFTASSAVAPKKYFKLDILKGELDFYSSNERVPYFDENNFKIYRTEIPSLEDKSINIPITIAHQKRIKPDTGDNRVLLIGYGAYRDSIFSSFSHNLAILLNKGYILAFAHCRGGGELGQAWYDAGRILNKKNTFFDFVACAQYFIDAGWTTPSKLTARGTSAGALTVAAAANMRPELFGSIILHVPFLDVLEIMTDPSLPMTVAEYEEFGNPNDEEIYQYMKSYAPLENLCDSIRHAKQFPNVYVTASLSDVNTPFWNALRYVAKLRQCLHIEGLEDKVQLISNFDPVKGHAEYPSGIEGMRDGIRSEISFLGWSEKQKSKIEEQP